MCATVNAYACFNMVIMFEQSSSAAADWISLSDTKSLTANCSEMLRR